MRPPGETVIAADFLLNQLGRGDCLAGQQKIQVVPVMQEFPCHGQQQAGFPYARAVQPDKRVGEALGCRMSEALLFPRSNFFPIAGAIIDHQPQKGL